jgi:hypothetical protein
MKIISYLSVLLFFTVSIGCSQTDKESKGEMTFKGALTHNYGQIAYGGDGSHNFIFKNTGKSTLIITNVVSSCGCTVPSYPKKPIEKGESDTIRVMYNTEDVGSFAKSVVVHHTGPDSPVILRIQGEVLPPENSDY